MQHDGEAGKLLLHLLQHIEAQLGLSTGLELISTVAGMAMTASIREYMALHPDHFDPRQYLKPARQAIEDMVAHKIVDVLGCDGKAF